MHPELFDLYKNNYHKAIRSVFGQPEYGSKYFEHAAKFELNTARFAAYKSHYATQTLIKSFKAAPEKFAMNSGKILKQFARWQATEYNTTVARCRTAKQFEQFQAEAHLYPNLEWLASRSATPRELHMSFVGIILPMDDPFWEENQPGNLYNCKCDWKTTDAPTTGSPTKVVKPHPGLDGNPAKTGQIFTDKHSYFGKAKNSNHVEKFVSNTFIKPLLKEFSSTIHPYKGIEVHNEILKTGKMVVLRNSVDSIFQHSNNYRVKAEGLFLKTNVKNWTYLGWSLVEEGKHPETAYFFYYSTTINKKKQFVNVKIHKHLKAEVPYAILNTIDKTKLREGLPEDIDKYIKKRL